MQHIKKYGTRVMAVKATVIRDVESDKGAVVQTVRDDSTGELLQTEKMALDEVRKSGLPLPDPLVIAIKS
jgi:hypothetical protein